MNTGLMPPSRDTWAHWIIMSMMATDHSAYSPAAIAPAYPGPSSGSSRNAVVTTGKNSR